MPVSYTPHSGYPRVLSNHTSNLTILKQRPAKITRRLADTSVQSQRAQISPSSDSKQMSSDTFGDQNPEENMQSHFSLPVTSRECRSNLLNKNIIGPDLLIKNGTQNLLIKNCPQDLRKPELEPKLSKQELSPAVSIEELNQEPWTA